MKCLFNFIVGPSSPPDTDKSIGNNLNLCTLWGLAMAFELARWIACWMRAFNLALLLKSSMVLISNPGIIFWQNLTASSSNSSVGAPDSASTLHLRVTKNK